MGKPVCPALIEMYTEDLKTVIEQMPYIKNKYTINTEKLMAKISANQAFCDKSAIRIGSKMIEQMGENLIPRDGISTAAMTWECEVMTAS